MRCVSQVVGEEIDRWNPQAQDNEFQGTDNVICSYLSTSLCAYYVNDPHQQECNLDNACQPLLKQPFLRLECCSLGTY
jgi:hypothetical protein